MFLLLLSAALACNMATAFYDEPEPRMGVRFTRRGLERFCQKGYSLVPDIISKMPVFKLPEIMVAGLRISLSNIKLMSVRVATMKVYLLSNNSVKMEARDGLMQLSMRLDASMLSLGLSGIVDCTFTLKDFGADISMKLGEDSGCPYHLGLFDISNIVYSSGFDIDATGADNGGSIIANIIYGMKPTLEGLVQNTVLQSLLNTIFNSIKQSMLKVPIIVQFNEFFSDQRYIGGVNVISDKVVANYGGMITIADPNNWKNQVVYHNPAPLCEPKIIYTDREYELFFDRESINSYLHAWHVAHDKFRADGLSIPYSAVKLKDLPGLKDVLIKEGILSNENDPGTDVTLTLSVHTSKNPAPHVPWIGAAALPVNLTGSFSVTASKLSTSSTLISVDGSVLFSSVLKLRKELFGYANDQARAYLVLTDLNNIDITTSAGGVVSNVDSLLRYMIMSKYLPSLNKILYNPGLPLMNGNFVDTDTSIAIYLCNESRVLFVADIEENLYFP